MNSTTAPSTINAGLDPVFSAYLDALKGSMPVLLVCAIWLGISIPLLILFLYTSPKNLRSSPIFIANLISILTGIALGVLNVSILTQSFFDPLADLKRSELLAYVFMCCTVGIYIDSILLFRVFAVFPIRTTPRRISFIIFTPLLLLKLARVVTTTSYVVQFTQKSAGIQRTSQYEPLARGLIQQNIEWALQLADNSLCSCLFLWKLDQGLSISTRIRGRTNGKNTYHKALGTLFRIAASNFVFPCMFNIVLYILFFRDPDGNHYLMVLISNNYVMIIGVLFATIWRATNDGQASDQSSDFYTKSVAIQFAHDHNFTNKTPTTASSSEGIMEINA